MLALPAGLTGQAPKATEIDLGALATWARRDFYGASLGAAARPGGQGRVAFTVGAGSAGGSAAVRLEGTAQFLVTPGARHGVTPYAGLGFAYVGVRGVPGSAVMLALLGVEQAAGRPHGWFLELGLGGGTRLRLGYRWRSLPPWWP